jgi:hypothetical protein
MLNDLVEVLGKILGIRGTKAEDSLSTSINNISTNNHSVAIARQLNSIEILLKFGIDLFKEITEDSNCSFFLEDSVC